MVAPNTKHFIAKRLMRHFHAIAHMTGIAPDKKIGMLYQLVNSDSALVAINFNPNFMCLGLGFILFNIHKIISNHLTYRFVENFGTLMKHIVDNNLINGGDVNEILNCVEFYLEAPFSGVIEETLLKLLATHVTEFIHELSKQ